MVLNENVAKGKWLEVKGEIQKTWGRLNNDELEKSKGDLKVIGGLIQQKYGQTQESYTERLNKIVKNFSEDKDKIVGNVERKFRK